MNNKKIEKIRELFQERGKQSYEIAKTEILKEKIEYEPVRDALQYFIKELWHNFHHPALLSLTCEAVGGDPKQTTRIGAAIVLLTGAADIHDDVIDKSLMKASKPTLLGKFGLEIALLVGDALFLKGSELLYESCKSLTMEERTVVIRWIKEAFFNLGVAVARETALRGRWDIDPKEYLDIITMKAAIADITSRIGAFIGGGKREEIVALGRYGRILGTLATIRDDFIDIFEPEELQNRIRNECVPLPLLYALKDPSVSDEIASFLKKGQRDVIKEEDCWEIVEKIRKARSFKVFYLQLEKKLRIGQKQLKVISNKHTKVLLSEILEAMTEDIL